MQTRRSQGSGRRPLDSFPAGPRIKDGANRFPAVPCFCRIARPAAVKFRS